MLDKRNIEAVDDYPIFAISMFDWGSVGHEWNYSKCFSKMMN